MGTNERTVFGIQIHIKYKRIIGSAEHNVSTFLDRIYEAFSVMAALSSPSELFIPTQIVYQLRWPFLKNNLTKNE